MILSLIFILFLESSSTTPPTVFCSVSFPQIKYSKKTVAGQYFHSYLCRRFSDGMEIFMSELLEIIMIVSFGFSWPLNVIKSYMARTTKGKSLSFLCLIFFGYIAGIASKFANPIYMASFEEKWYVLFFYFLNLIMVGIDICLYFRNIYLERKGIQI